MSNLQTVFLHNEYKFLKNPDLLKNITKTVNDLKKLSDDLLKFKNTDTMNAPMIYENFRMFSRLLQKYMDEAAHRGINGQIVEGVLPNPITVDTVPTLVGISYQSIETLAVWFGERDIQKFISFLVYFNFINAGSCKLLQRFITIQTDQVYNSQELQNLWIKSGGKPEHAKIMAAIALAESSGKPSVINKSNNNGTWDIGLWQINTIHQGAFGLPTIPNYKDPTIDSDEFVQLLQNPHANASAASRIQSSQGFKAWVTYNTEAYLKYM